MYSVDPALNIAGHLKARRCYAWSYLDKGETQLVTLLEVSPVVSPKMAVRVALRLTRQRDQISQRHEIAKGGPKRNVTIKRILGDRHYFRFARSSVSSTV
jgi:hypothetical protein